MFRYKNSTPRSESNQNVIKTLLNMPMEQSWLLGGASSLFAISTLTQIYETITFLLEYVFDSFFYNIYNQNSTKYKIEVFENNDSLITPFVVIDQICGIILSSNGLYYVDSLDMSLYKYKDKFKNQNQKFYFKLRPYVYNLLKSIDTRNPTNINTYSLFTNELLHMILNDILKMFEENKNIRNGFSNEEKNICNVLIDILKEKSNTPIQAHQVLTNWISKLKSDDKWTSIKKLFDTKMTSQSNIYFYVNSQDSIYIDQSQSKKEIKGFDVSCQYINELKVFSVREVGETFDIWEKIESIRYTIINE